VSGPERGADDADGALIVANEFAAVAVRKVATRNGERVEIRSLGNDAHVIRLDALALEALTWSDPLEVGRGLETPLGPEPGPTTSTTPTKESN
jgi:hypothetical protein